MPDSPDRKTIAERLKRDPQAQFMRRVTAGAMLVIAIIAFPAAAITYVQDGLSSPDEIKAKNNPVPESSNKHELEFTAVDDVPAQQEPKPMIVSENVTFDGNSYTIRGAAVSATGERLSGEEVEYEFFDAAGLSYGTVRAVTDSNGDFALHADGENLTSVNTIASFACISANGISQGQASALIEAASAPREAEEAAPETVENTGQYFIWQAVPIGNPTEPPSDNQLGRFEENWYIAQPGTSYYQLALKSLRPGDTVAVDGKTVVIEGVKNCPSSVPREEIVSELGDDKVFFVRYRTDGGYGIAYGRLT